MARAILFTIFTMLFVMTHAVPKDIDHKHFRPSDIINALNQGIITQFHTIITLESLVTNLVRVDLSVKNPLPIELTIKDISVFAGLNDKTYIIFNHTLDLVLPSSGTNNTGVIGNALLIRGAIASLEIIPAGILDILDMNVSVSAATKYRGRFGISLDVDGLKQDMVPARYDLSLSGV